MQPQRKAKKDTPAPRRTHIACLPCCPSRPSSRARNEDTHGFPFLISALHPEDEDQSFNSLSDLVREEGDPPCSHPCHARCCTLLLLLLYDEVIENKYLLLSEKALLTLFPISF